MTGRLGWLPTGLSRRHHAALMLVLVLFGFSGWLFRPGHVAGPTREVGLDSLSRIDGTLNVVEEDRLVLKPLLPQQPGVIEFEIPVKYRGNFDLAHLRAHSSLGIPTRLFYLRQGARYLAVYKTDTPANGAP